MTHHCIQDIGYMSSIPNINIFTPANKYEMEKIFEIECGLKYIRIDKSELNLISDNKRSGLFYQCYFTNKKYDKKDKTLILAHGSIGEITKSFLNEKNKFDFYTIPYLKETKKIVDLCRGYKQILTIEEHSVVNGFFSFITLLLIKNKVFKKIEYIALDHEHSSLVGDQNYLRDKLLLNVNLLSSRFKI